MDWSDDLLASLLVKLNNWLRKLFGVTDKNSKDPFLKMQSRAIRAGAWAGLAGAVVGIVVSVVIAGIVEGVGTPSFYLLAIPGLFVCPPFPLLGAAAGAVIGRLDVKRDEEPDESSPSFRKVKLRGGIAGLAIGSILPYTCGWLFNSVFHLVG